MGLEDELGTAGGRAAVPSRVRSKAWIYYLILAVCCFIAVCTGQFIGLLGMVLFGAYSTYLFRGGQVVIWFW